jgi:hypothetical protein
MVGLTIVGDSLLLIDRLTVRVYLATASGRPVRTRVSTSITRAGRLQARTNEKKDRTHLKKSTEAFGKVDRRRSRSVA